LPEKIAHGDPVCKTLTHVGAGISLHGPVKIVRPVRRAWMGIDVPGQALHGRFSGTAVCVSWDVSKLNPA